jgi:hypothetical protein
MIYIGQFTYKLKRYATNRKVAGSRPYEVNDIYQFS